jgi:uncharacterized membrane protein
MKPKQRQIKSAAIFASCATLLGASFASAEVLEFNPQSGVEGLEIAWNSPDEARANQPYAYTLTVSNTNDMPLNQVRIFQMIGGNFQVNSSEPRQAMKPGDKRKPEMASGHEGKAKKQARPSKTTYQWNLGMMKPGEKREIKVSGLPSAEGKLEACLWATGQAMMCRTIDVVKPDLEIVQTLVDAEGNERLVFYACEPLIANYVVTNPGSGTAEDIRAKVNLPKGLILAGDQSTDLDVGTLNGGESKEFKVTLQPSEVGTYSLSAKAMSEDLSAESNRASVEIVRPTLKLNVEAPKETYLGREVTYRIMVENTSDVPALDTMVNLPLDAENRRFTNTGQEIDNDVQIFQLGTIDGGDSRSFSITFEPRGTGDLQTMVSAEAYCAKAVKTKIKSTVSGVSALQIYVVDREDPIKVGDETSYELKVTNEGTAKDEKINLKGMLPDSLTFVDSDGDSEITADGQNLKFGPIDKLEPGETVSWKIKVKGAEAGRDVFNVDLDSRNRKKIRSSEPTTVY